MGNTIGNIFRFTIWGQSHAPQIGVTIEGIPAGTRIDLERLQAFLDRRRPGRDQYSTKRSEADMPVFVAGLLPEITHPAFDDLSGDPGHKGSGSLAGTSGNTEPGSLADSLPGYPDAGMEHCAQEDSARIGIACGAPVTAVIRNQNTRSSDYEALRYVPRPGHADYAAMVKYGEARDLAGGGQFSGRLTAPLCIAGGIALQILEKKGIRIEARPVMIGGETEDAQMLEAIDRAREAGDSVGGIVECVVEGVPAGVGEPMFDGIENRIAQMVFGIPAVKGIEFGVGFAAAGMRGSENNDPFFYEPVSDAETLPDAVSRENTHEEVPLAVRSLPDCTAQAPGSTQEKAVTAVSSLPGCTAQVPGSTQAEPGQDILSCIRTLSNHHGGALGGISSGMPIVFRAAFKPTPSISKTQDSVDVRTGQAVKLNIRGRHDPCIVLRAVPVVEAAAAAAVYDLMLQGGCF